MKLRELLPPAISRAFRRRGKEGQRWQEMRIALAEAKALSAKLLIAQQRLQAPLANLSEAEFKVYSQFGDDGIIQYLVHLLRVEPPTFVEFGVENYQEANTRFLLVNDNWRGLVFDGSAVHVEAIRRDPIHWRHDLTAAAAFIDRDNIEGLLAEHGFTGELGLLSIDIDGNDYWVWERIECVRPTLVVVEYNAVFGCRRAVSVPYDPAFQRTRAHYSNLYWGCSLPALCALGRRKGYAFVGANSNGNNAYFVRRDRFEELNAKRPGALRELAPAAGYVESKFRESRDEDGRLTYLAGAARLAAIADQTVVDVESGESVSCRDL